MAARSFPKRCLATAMILLFCSRGMRGDERPAGWQPALTFAPAVELEVAGQAARFEGHVATRCHDWDQDGDVDLLVGGGDGRLWLLRNRGSRQQPEFQPQEPIQAEARQRWGTSFTGVTLANLIGTELPDLIVAHSENQITIHENIGTRQEPKFTEAGTSVPIQQGCQGRFDVADWDEDGLDDLITGSFGGDVQWHRNLSRGQQLKFGEGQAFQNLSVAYNSHPRLVDFNQDGQLDVLLGVNWGTVSLYLSTGDVKTRTLRGNRPLQWSDGKDLNIRELNGDDTTPEVADLDGDDVVDLISGGRNGRLFFARGIGYSSRLSTLATLLNQHAADLGRILRDDESVRDQLFGALVALQADLAAGLIPTSAREQMFERLSQLAQQYPAILRRAKFDLSSGPQLPILAGQFWTVLFETQPDSPKHRERVADALGFAGGYRNLLVEHGVVLIDNDTATPEHLAAMSQLIAAIPRAVWDVETITVAGWLGPAIRTQRIQSRSGINIFDLPLGRPENSFPADAPRPGVTDVFLICLAHELAHNMLDTVGRTTRPELYERKFAGLAQAAGTEVVYRTPRSAGIDLDATRKNFQAAGAWDGEESTWNSAWTAYFSNKEQYDKAHTRGNIQFFLDAPQEAFATLANQYFADSQLMLEFCWSRWEAGHRSNINQFLLIADYLSGGTDRVSFYVLRTGGDLTVQSVQLERDARGRIVRVLSERSVAEFEYDASDLVTAFRHLSKER